MRPRPIFVLPAGVNLSDFDFAPTAEEKALEKKLRLQAKRRLVNLSNLQKLWQREEDAYLKRMDALRQKHVAVIFAQVEQDRIWLEKVNAIQEEQKRVTDYWLAEHEKESKAIHAAHLKKLAAIQEDIRKDNARAERQELDRKGLVRGKRL
jgi:hypothetical protein